jgi:diguanylate cyclase (GGDEF)-like protein
MVDIDYFKKVNDGCGHQGGDRVLVGVSEILRAVVGRKGRAYRYGGEEMAAILPDFILSEAAATAERFRKAVEARNWNEAGFPDLRSTVSLGVSEFPILGIDAEALVATADKALYAAKEGGRNRVVAAG